MLLRHLTSSTFVINNLKWMTTRMPYLLQFKRCKHKKKWATNLKAKSHTEKALDHFDTFYKPVYGNLWPSIRVALLSQQKYCALLNNFSQDTSISKTLQDLGANDIMEMARLVSLDEGQINLDVKNNKNVMGSRDEVSIEAHNVSKTQRTVVKKSTDSTKNNSVSDYTMENEYWHEEDLKDTITNAVDVHQSAQASFRYSHSVKQSVDDLIDPLGMNPDTNLDEFMPVEKVYSKRELLERDVVQKSVFEPRDIQADTVVTKEFNLPSDLRVFAFRKGNVSDFPAPKPDVHEIIGYYLLDAASILPIIALDLQPHDTVLDLCAAPGGKTLAMLQFMNSDSVTCNDLSMARLRRLQTVLRWYYPDRRDVNILQRDGRKLNEQIYTKVLVDVPCSTDRHVLLEDDNNLFKPSRVSERLQMPTVQKDLLLAGIRCCKPGGSVVYSTCTLSPAQNDGVIQAVVEELWQETNIDIVIHDLGWIAAKFNNTFKFYDQCRHGQLVIPSLTSNFGPMYFSKITRLS